jgi:hypothetical protein
MNISASGRLIEDCVAQSGRKLFALCISSGTHFESSKLFMTAARGTPCLQSFHILSPPVLCFWVRVAPGFLLANSCTVPALLSFSENHSSCSRLKVLSFFVVQGVVFTPFRLLSLVATLEVASCSLRPPRDFFWEAFELLMAAMGSDSRSVLDSISSLLESSLPAALAKTGPTHSCDRHFLEPLVIQSFYSLLFTMVKAPPAPYYVFFQQPSSLPAAP